MPVYGLGTWQMGGRFERDLNNDDAADIQAVKKAIDLGVTHIDTAEKYAEGHAEELVGEAIKGYSRTKIFLVSKVGSNHLRHDDLLNSAERSLKRLGVDYLDLYLLHSPSLEIPIQETMKAMDKLLADGLIKNMGVSNFSIERLKEAQSLTRNKIVANQLHYNLLVREAERKGLVEYCQANDVMFIAWRPVQKGILTEAGIAVLDGMVKKYQKTPAQIAINWLISQDNVITLSKTSSPGHLKENLGALGWQMEEADIEILRKEFPNQLEVSDAVPLK